MPQRPERSVVPGHRASQLLPVHTWRVPEPGTGTHGASSPEPEAPPRCTGFLRGKPCAVAAAPTRAAGVPRSVRGVSEAAVSRVGTQKPPAPPLTLALPLGVSHHQRNEPRMLDIDEGFSCQSRLVKK